MYEDLPLITDINLQENCVLNLILLVCKMRDNWSDNRRQLKGLRLKVIDYLHHILLFVLSGSKNITDLLSYERLPTKFKDNWRRREFSYPKHKNIPCIKKNFQSLDITKTPFIQQTNKQTNWPVMKRGRNGNQVS